MQITVEVPDDRVADYYRMVADFFAGRPTTSGALVKQYDDADPARQFVKLLSTPAKRIFKLLLARSPEHVDAEEIATICEIRNGRSGVAGSFGWPAQHATKLGIEAPWQWQDRGFGTDYWLDAAQANFLRAALDEVA